MVSHQSPLTVGSTALAALRRHSDRTAFSWGGFGGVARESLTYAGALDAIGRTQAAYAASGLARGDGIAILSGNRADSWVCAMAAWCSGLRVTYLHPKGSLADHLHQLSDSGARALVLDPGAFEARGAEIEGATDLDVILSFGPSGVGRDLWREREAVGASTPHDLGRPDDVLWLNYTGGTTGRPKGVVYRHASVLSHTRSILTDFELPASPRYLAVAPITHVGGTKIMPVLHRGGTVHLLDGYTPEAVLAAVEAERLSMALFVPTMVYDLLDHPDLDRADLSSLEVALYGASPMSPTRLVEGQERIGNVFAQLYGQSECYPISYLPRDEHLRADPAVLASCGFPVHGTAVALLDDDGQQVAPGESGEICVRSTAAMEGYWNQPDVTAEALAGGWLHTGDIGRTDERGLLSIVDRKKDMVVTGGFNVFPREVEDALAAHPQVRAAAVYGLPDERWGEAVTATVVLRDGATVTEAELRDWVRERKGPVQTPKRVLTAPALPLTAVGKVDKKALRAQP